ncbi:MAG: protein-methionine-sulfoxide reductase catalytic subunit MsrP [Myxococcota bacterium]
MTSEAVFLRRRELVRNLGLAAGSLLVGCRETPAPRPVSVTAPSATTEVSLYPARRSRRYRVDRALTPPEVASRYNNFYEISTDKDDVWRLAEAMPLRPWGVEVVGSVHAPRTFSIDELERLVSLEERVYRFRCVEAWAMVVPWTGLPLRALLDRVRPLGSAHYVRFVTVHDTRMPGIRNQPHYPWPYFEALRLDEAMNELTLLATGIYGRPLPPQHGAPVRLVVPWKYGFKSIKSIVRIEVLEERPSTFWSQLQPAEYGFVGNVDPATPHPRWSQAEERMIDTGARVPTQPYNGYGEWVASLYPGGASATR